MRIKFDLVKARDENEQRSSLDHDSFQMLNVNLVTEEAVSRDDMS